MADSGSKRVKGNVGDQGRRRHPSFTRSKTAVGLGNGPLSDFPDDVLTNIISFLPVKQAVRASTVSSGLKQSWLFTRNLCFGKDFARCYEQKEFLKIVNRVFGLHLGPKIQSFSLVFDPADVEITVENWIQISLDKGVEELDLNFGQAKVPYRISSDFDDVETIKILKLCHCELELLPNFKGLVSLTTLILRKIEIDAKSLETMFLNCMTLETVDLVKCRKIGPLKIFAQNLKRFKALRLADCSDLSQMDVDAPTVQSIYYTGKLISFKFSNISQLNDVMLNFKPRKAISKFFKTGGYLCDLSHVPIISTSSTLIEDLSPGLYDERAMQLSFTNLRELQLFMGGALYCNLYDIAHFLKKCPRLQKLFIDLRGFSFESQQFWELHQRELIEQDRHLLRCLEFVKIEGFKFEEHEMEVVKYLLERSIVLENLVLVAPKTAGQGAMQVHNIPTCRKICERSPISPLVKARFYCQDNDLTPVPKHSRTWYYENKASK